MMNANDKAITKLQEQAQKKQAALGKRKRLSPITTCSLELDGQRYNLHVADWDTLVLLQVKLSVYADKATELGYECRISGFALNDWLHDIQGRLDQIEQSQKIQELNQAESQLTTLLTAETKTAQQIANIAAALGLDA